MVTVCSSKALPILYTKMRDISTSSAEFVKYSKRAMRLVAEDALAAFPASEILIDTPCQKDFPGVATLDPTTICAVSVVRSGDALLEAARDVEPGLRVGKILIQRDESLPDKPAKLFYSKLPPGVESLHILLCDPMQCFESSGSLVRPARCGFQQGCLCNNGVCSGRNQGSSIGLSRR